MDQIPEEVQKVLGILDRRRNSLVGTLNWIALSGLLGEKFWLQTKLDEVRGLEYEIKSEFGLAPKGIVEGD